MSVKNLFDLTHRIALITGASRGLGLQMAVALGEMGCKVAITTRKNEELELGEAAAQLEKRGITCLPIVNDLTSFDQIPSLVDAVLAKYGTLDILVNNAGTNWAAPAEDYPIEAWNKVMNLNINAMFLLCREVGKRVMIPNKSGKIINIASIGGLSGGPPDMTTIAYIASKGAAVNFTRGLASEWGKYNINVNSICPGFFPSKMSKGILEKIEAKVIADTPLHRLGGEDDLMGTVVFLASEASRHITGQFIAVDGGASIV